MYIFLIVVFFAIVTGILVIDSLRNNNTENTKMKQTVKLLKNTKINKLPSWTNEEQKIANSDFEIMQKFSDTLKIHYKNGYLESNKIGTELLMNVLTMVKRLNINSSSNDSLSKESLDALVKYGDIIRKIDVLYGETVFLDIKNNPLLWKNNGEDFIQDILETVTNVNQYVLEDIKKFNENKTFDIKTAIASISSSTNRDAEQAIDNIFKEKDRKQKEI